VKSNLKINREEGLFLMKDTTKTYDILLKNLEIIDGSGAPSFYGNIGIKGDTIVDVGNTYGNAALEIDCTGLIAAPGFIDIHNHSDISIFEEPSAANYIYQGVTTIVNGNCGYSGAPINKNNLKMLESLLKQELHEVFQRGKLYFGEYLDLLDRQAKAVNIAPLVGHGNIRGAVIGMDNEKASSQDLERMKELLKEAMGSGAFGMSTGLIYDPGIFADTHELIELSKVVAQYGGLYVTHMRNESDLLIESVLEAIKIGKDSGARVEISHHKASGKKNWGLVKTTLSLMEYYRRFGVEVTCDVYPCVYCQTGLHDCFPNWIRGNDFLEKLKDDAVKERLRKELSHPSVEFENIILDSGFDGIIIGSSAKFKQYQGKTVAEVSKLLGKDPLDTIFYLVENDVNISVMTGGMNEDDVIYIMKNGLSMICSDSEVMKLGQGMPHPRGYRAFTRFLSTYVRDESIMSLQEAIRKITSMPAWKLGIPDRGLLKPGFKADIAIFDYWELNYRSDYGDPHHYSEGMVYVLNNGKPIIMDEKYTGETPGKVLRRAK